MPKKWIVGVDGSECSRHAGRWASRHAPGRADSIELLAAWSPPVAPALPPLGPFASGWDIEAFESAARESVDSLAEELIGTTTVDVTTDVGRGPTSSVLLDAAHDAAMLVVGSRGRGGFAQLVLGSTSTQCATHASVPTAVIPHDAPIESSNKVVVAVDGSPNSIDAVRWAAGFAATGTTIECVSVWDVTPIAIGADQFYFPETSDLAHERFEHQVNALIDELSIGSASHIDVTRRFVHGRIRFELAEIAAEADLFVMGARGHGAIGAALLGSVSTWMLHHVHVPMVIVPHRTTTVDASSTAASEAATT